MAVTKTYKNSKFFSGEYCTGNLGVITHQDTLGRYQRTYSLRPGLSFSGTFSLPIDLPSNANVSNVTISFSRSTSGDFTSKTSLSVMLPDYGNVTASNAHLLEYLQNNPIPSAINFGFSFGYVSEEWTAVETSEYPAQGSPGQRSANLNSITVTLEIVYDEVDVGGTISFGVNNAWQKCNVFFGTGGEWKQCKAFFGADGAWKETQ